MRVERHYLRWEAMTVRINTFLIAVGVSLALGLPLGSECKGPPDVPGSKTPVAQPQASLPSDLTAEFARLENLIEEYRKAHGSYPKTLEEVWQCPGLERSWACPDFSLYAYARDADRDTYTLQHKKHKELFRVDPTDPASRQAALDSPHEIYRCELVRRLTDSREDLDLLVRLLRSDPLPDVRATAVFQVEQKVPAGLARPLLLEALLDPSPGVWGRAAGALSRLDRSRFEQDVAEWAKSEDPQKRLLAARGLSYVVGENWWGLLGSLLECTDPEVRILAAQSAYIRGEPGSCPEEVKKKLLAAMRREQPPLKYACARAAARLRLQEAAPVLVEALQHEKATREIRENVTCLLWVKSDIKAEVSALRRFLKYPDPWVRSEAITALTLRDYPGVLEDCLALLKDPDPEVEKTAIGAICGIKGLTNEQRISRLLPFFEDENADIRLEVTQMFSGYSPCWCPGHLEPTGLCSLKAPRTIGPLTRALQDPDYRVRVMAAGALMLYRDPSTSESLVAALTDTLPWRQFNSPAGYTGFALQQIKIKVPIEKIRDALLIAEPRSMDGIGPLARDCPERKALERMLHARIPAGLKSNNEREVMGALVSLRHFPLREVESDVMELSRHPCYCIRLQAMRILSRNRSEAWHTRLLELRDDLNREVRSEASRNLSEMDEWKEGNSPLAFYEQVFTEGNDQHFRSACEQLLEELKQGRVFTKSLLPLEPLLRKRIEALPENKRADHPGVRLIEQPQALGRTGNR
jgi:hypothetical protein